MADARKAGQRELGALYRAFAVACIETGATRTLLRLGFGDPYGYSALRDAFTMMLLAGVPPDFKAAFVTDEPHLGRSFQALEQDLQRLGIKAAAFDRAADAISWLDCERPQGRDGRAAAGLREVRAGR